MTARTRSEYTGTGPRRLGLALACALAVWIGCPGLASADPSDWHLVPLPGGRAALLPRLNLSPDLPRALVVGEIVRTVFQARDTRSRQAVALAEYFAHPPSGGDEQIPLPLAPAVWSAILGRPVTDRDLLGAILADRRAALLCYGLFGVDAETRAFVAANPAIVGDMSERGASVFASFASVVRIRNGALDLPGAEAADTWSALIGAPISDPMTAIPALLGRDNGRLAYFAEGVAELDAAHQALIFPPGAPLDAQLAAARDIYRSFVNVDQARNLAELTFQRIAYGPADLLAALTVDAPGGLDWSASYWDTLLSSDNVPSDGPGAWEDLDTVAPANPATLLDRLAQEALPGRLEIVTTAHFLARLSRLLPGATPADRVLLGRAVRRYPALLLTLERIGVDDLAVWHGLVQQARAFDARAGTGRESDMRCALLQAPIALIDRAVQVHALDPSEATTLLGQLARVDWTTDAPGRAVALWIDTALLPAFGGGPVAAGEAESRLLEGLAGFARSASAPASMVRLIWEGNSYRVDPAASELARLHEVRNAQGGDTLDTALELARAGAALAAPSGPASLQGAVQTLAHVRAALQPVDENEPLLLPVDVGRIVDQVLADLRRRSTDASHSAAGASHLARAEDALVADVLTSIVYALWLGDPGGQAFLGGNVARRHEFGQRSSAPGGAQREWWMVPAEASGAGEPWHVRGALLALDVGLGRLALRRTSVDLPQQRPWLNEGDRRGFIASLVLMPSLDATDDTMKTLVEWVADGRAAAARLGEPDVLPAVSARLGLDTRRREAARWTAGADPADLPRLFAETELLELGRPADVSALDGWGPAEMPRTGCLCRGLPDPVAPHRAAGLVGTGILASRMDDLELHVLEELSAMHLPALLAKGVVASALQDYLDEVRPAYWGDWWTLTQQARTLSHEQLVDYVSALAAGGPLVPADAPVKTDGHP